MKTVFKSLSNSALGRMDFFFPWIASEIDWAKKYKFRDKEFQQIVRDASLGRRWAVQLIFNFQL